MRWLRSSSYPVGLPVSSELSGFTTVYLPPSISLLASCRNPLSLPHLEGTDTYIPISGSDHYFGRTNPQNQIHCQTGSFPSKILRGCLASPHLRRLSSQNTFLVLELCFEMAAVFGMRSFAKHVLRNFQNVMNSPTQIIIATKP